MKGIRFIIVLISILIASVGQAYTEPVTGLDHLMAQCAPEVNPITLKAVIKTESSFNPYAIGVVGGNLVRQPHTLEEAVATAIDLEKKGYNFSLGLGQVNRYHLANLGETYQTVFDICTNLKAGSQILRSCYQNAYARNHDKQQALRAAFSCYYSGNFTWGFRSHTVGKPSYVQQVLANAETEAQPIEVVPAIKRTTDEVKVRILKKPATPITPKPEVDPQNMEKASIPFVIFPDPKQNDTAVKPAPAQTQNVPFVQIMN